MDKGDLHNVRRVLFFFAFVCISHHAFRVIKSEGSSPFFVDLKPALFYGFFYVNTVMCSSSHGTALKCVVVQHVHVNISRCVCQREGSEGVSLLAQSHGTCPQEPITDKDLQAYKL